jgi:hypothetical protein
MCVKWGLEWGSDKTDVHSMHFAVGIAFIGEIASPNFKPKFKTIEHIMKHHTFTATTAP